MAAGEAAATAPAVAVKVMHPHLVDDEHLVARLRREAMLASRLPPAVTARVGIEAGIKQGWEKYLGTQGAFIGLDTFGASAPFEEIYKQRGITAAAVVAKAKELVAR